MDGDRGAAPELHNSIGTPVDLWGPGDPQPSPLLIGAEFFKLVAVCSRREAPFPARVLGLLIAYRTTRVFPPLSLTFPHCRQLRKGSGWGWQ